MSARSPRPLIVLRPRSTPLASFWLTTALTLLAGVSAMAQDVGGGGIARSGFHPPTQGVGQKARNREAAPPGLPGSQPTGNAPAPVLELDVPPTEALFDAINRGDLASARDALGRGADLNGRNVLGMTPLDLSVDLSRNDITFLLMSMRGQDTVGGPPSVAPGARVPAVAGTKRLVASKPPHAVAVTSHQRPTPSSRQAPPVRYADVPVVPVPQAGFLGFGTTASP